MSRRRRMTTISYETWQRLRNAKAIAGNCICEDCYTIHNLANEPRRHACSCGSDIHGVSWVQHMVRTGKIAIMAETGLMMYTETQ